MLTLLANEPVLALMLFCKLVIAALLDKLTQLPTLVRLLFILVNVFSTLVNEPVRPVICPCCVL